VDALGVLLRDLVVDGGQVGDVTTDEEVGVEVSGVDLLREVCEEDNPSALGAKERKEREKTNRCGKA
jgi:hypothetical protein